MDKKEKVLDNLYALRAGLSVISQEYDKAQAIENECGEKLAENANSLDDSLVCYQTIYPELIKLQEHYGYDRDIYRKLDEVEPEIHESFITSKSVERHNSREAKLAANRKKASIAYAHWLAYDESTQYFQKNLANAQNRKGNVAAGNDTRTSGLSYKSEGRRYKILAIVFFILTAIALIPPIALAAFISTKSIIVFLSLFPVVFLILGIVFLNKSKHYKLQHTSAVNAKDGEVRTAQSMLEKLPEVREKARAILKQKDDKIAPIKESCNEFYMALKKQFSSLLDERDWQNLDLVIYELETRRADSVKEALQLVDRELQTERIQQTIVLATEQISYEIRRGFAELKETMIECSRVISAQLSVVNLQLEEVSGQLSELTDSVNLGNALQAKANVTSSQLMSEVHAIRYYQ